MGLKFTPSSDGVDRASVRITIRLTADEIRELKRQAKEHGSDWRARVQGLAALGIEEALIAEGGELEQHYGRGGG